MSQTTAIILMFILYGVLPTMGGYLIYWSFKRWQRSQLLSYPTMPALGYMPQNSLPDDIKYTLDIINQKGEKLRQLYGDTNNDGKIDEKDIANETYVMIQNLLDKHIPSAVNDYRRLHDLNNEQSYKKIQHSDVTGKEALLEVLNTVNTEFDKLLELAYHQDGQKLLATNRYLKHRFERNFE